MCAKWLNDRWAKQWLADTMINLSECHSYTKAAGAECRLESETVFSDNLFEQDKRPKAAVREAMQINREWLVGRSGWQQAIKFYFAKIFIQRLAPNWFEVKRCLLLDK